MPLFSFSDAVSGTKPDHGRAGPEDNEAGGGGAATDRSVLRDAVDLAGPVENGAPSLHEPAGDGGSAGVGAAPVSLRGIVEKS